MCFGTDVSSALHDRNLLIIFDEPHFIENRTYIDGRTRCTHPRSSLRAYGIEPGLNLGIECGAAAQCVKQRRRICHQSWQFAVNAIGWEGCVESEMRLGSIWSKTISIPDFAFFIFFAAEQNGLILIACHQHQGGFRLGESGQVVKIAVMSIRVIRIGIAHHFGCGLNDGDTATLCAHMLEDSGTAFCINIHSHFLVARGAFSCSSRSTVPTSVQSPRKSSPPILRCSANSRRMGASFAAVPAAIESNSSGR